MTARADGSKAYNILVRPKYRVSDVTMFGFFASGVYTVPCCLRLLSATQASVAAVTFENVLAGGPVGVAAGGAAKAEPAASARLVAASTERAAISSSPGSEACPRGRCWVRRAGS